MNDDRTLLSITRKTSVFLTSVFGDGESWNLGRDVRLAGHLILTVDLALSGRLAVRVVTVCRRDRARPPLAHPRVPPGSSRTAAVAVSAGVAQVPSTDQDEVLARQEDLARFRVACDDSPAGRADALFELADAVLWAVANTGHGRGV